MIYFHTPRENFQKIRMVKGDIPIFRIYTHYYFLIAKSYLFNYIEKTNDLENIYEKMI